MFTYSETTEDAGLTDEEVWLQCYEVMRRRNVACSTTECISSANIALEAFRKLFRKEETEDITN